MDSLLPHRRRGGGTAGALRRKVIVSATRVAGELEITWPAVQAALEGKHHAGFTLHFVEHHRPASKVGAAEHRGGSGAQGAGGTGDERRVRGDLATSDGRRQVVIPAAIVR